MRSEMTKRQLEIIEAAGKIISISGVGGLTTKNLANEMKFSESALYRHFINKEAIVIAMLNYLAESMDERYTEVITLKQSAEEKFTAIFRNQFKLFNRKPYYIAAVFSDGLMEESQKINNTIKKIMKVKVKHLTPIIIEGQETNVFTKSISSQDLTHIVMGTFRLQMFKWRANNFQSDIVKDGNRMIQSLLTLMKIK